MSVTPIFPNGKPKNRHEKRSGRVYAIAYDLNREAALQHGAWAKIARVLESYGFHRQQGTVFYGTEKTSASTCFAAVMDLNDKYPWFWEVVRDMRMLRIDEEDDLLAVIPNRLRFDKNDVA
jgi:virulence-associated protein VapD